MGDRTRRLLPKLPSSLLGLLLSFPCFACSSSHSAAKATLASAPPGDGSTLGEDASEPGADSGSTVVLTGPISGPGTPFTASVADLASLGYLEEEFFLEGDATAYDWQTPPSEDGHWSIMPTTTAHFKTRILVRRPSDPAKFNGTVVVEWLNVSGGVDADPDFVYANIELLRSGYAWAGVSAQAEGVVGGGFAIAGGGQPLVQQNPQRYGSLQHPGDNYCYDIYSQATRALRHASTALRPLGPLAPARFIATGESQSAIRMVTYANAIQPVDKLFDGIFIHSRAGGAAPLSLAADAGPLASLVGGGSGPQVVHIRDDLTIPVFQFLTETDVLGFTGGLGGFSAARQPDTDRLRSWEVAGTSHADKYLLDYEAPAAGDAGPQIQCTDVNEGPHHWVDEAALAALNAWVKDGTPPARGDPLILSDAGSGYAKDNIGNALGGVRTAAVDVPIAINSGQSTSSSILCSLFGHYQALSAAQLLSLYPTHDDYVNKVTEITNKAQQAGFILAADTPLIVQEARAQPVPQ
jgi:hypothetical protein